MADRPILSTIAADSQVKATVLNANFSALADAIELVLGRDGTDESPNSMTQNFDMDENRIINVGDPVNDGDAVNKAYVDGELGGVDDALVIAQDAASNASDSAAAAASSASSASSAQTAAESAQSSAEDARDAANKWATEVEDTPVNDGVNPIDFSAYHYAQKCADLISSLASGDFFEYDGSMDIMPALLPTQSSQWDLDGNDDIQPV